MPGLPDQRRFSSLLKPVGHVFNVPEFPRIEHDEIMLHVFFNGLLGSFQGARGIGILGFLEFRHIEFRGSRTGFTNH